MDYYRSKEETRVSRSGRVLKKTLKMKEMEDLVIEEDGEEKNRRRFRNRPVHPKPDFSKHIARTSAESHSRGCITSPSSSDISGEDTLYSKKSRSRIVSRSLKNSKVRHWAGKVLLPEGDSKWSSDVSSEDESNSSVSTTWTSGDSAIHSVRRGCTKRNSRSDGKQDNGTLKRKTNYFSKERDTNTRSAKSAPASRRTPFNLYAQKTGRNEYINKKLIFNELSNRLEVKNLSLPENEKVICQGKANLSLPKKEKVICHGKGNLSLPKKEKMIWQGKAKQAFSKQSGNSSTNCNEGPMSAADIKHQVNEESLELVVGNSTLGIEPIDVAAHLKLLGDSLTKIGVTVMNLDHKVPGAYSCLLDVLLCSVGPLLCLTREIAGLEGLPEDVFRKILDHIAYIIPGL